LQVEAQHSNFQPQDKLETKRWSRW